MPVRVKKLAAELNVSPQRVVEWLHEEGFSQYNNDMDMVVDLAAEKVRKAAKRALKVGPAIPPDRPPGRGKAVDPVNRMVAHLDPDRPVTQVAADAGRSLRGEALTSEQLRVEQARGRALAEEIVQERARARQALDTLELERRAMEEERRQLAMAREAMVAERVEAERELISRLAAIEAGASGVPLAALFERRGLRGLDEMSRALGALSRARVLDVLIPRLRVTDSDPVVALLRDRLALVSGVWEAEGIAAVSVPADRAEIPGDDELARLREQINGEFLLNGLRRVRFVGGPPQLVRVLRSGMDPRLDVQFSPARHRGGEDARKDVADADVVVLWQVTEDEEASDVYGTTRVVVVRAAGASMLDLHRAIRGGLSDS